MAAEEKRILKMFYLLTKTDGYIKANELAHLLSVSERTVKGEVEQLKAFIQKCGCTLESVRGKGYCLKIQDQACFQQSRERVEILFSNIDKGHKENQVYHIARAIMRFEGTDEEGYFRLENLADRLYISASAMKKEMPGVRDFLGSFNLSLLSRPGHGLQLAGDEFSQRLCILELYENHFRKRVVTFRDNEYEQAFADRGDKDLIRRATLEALRASDNEVFDIYVNRLVDYLLLMRNRVQAGFRLGQPGGPCEKYAVEICRYREYTLARKLAAVLETFPEFQADEGEVIGIALLLLLWGDWEEVPGLPQRFPAFYPEAVRLSQVLTKELGARWGLDFTRIDSAFPEKLVPGLLRILIQMHFGYSQCRLVGNSISENAIKTSLLSMSLADSLAELLYQACAKKINEYSIQLLAVRIYGTIDSIGYSYTPRRVLICARNGKDSAHVIAEAIRRRLGEWWINKIEISELYEARKYPAGDYDCLIGSFRPYAYRYSWPYIEVNQIPTPEDYSRIREQVVLTGYNVKEAEQLCRFDVVRVHRDFAGSSAESILQLIAYQWGRDLTAKEELARLLAQEGHARIHNKMMAIFIPASYTGQQIFELYIPKKSVLFREGSVKAILFVSVDFQNTPVTLRYMEHAVRYLAGQFEDIGKTADSSTIMNILTNIILKNM